MISSPTTWRSRQRCCPPGRIPTADVVGTRGLHVWVPVDGGDRTFAETSAFALGPAEVLARVASRGDLFAPALRPPPTARSDAP